MIRIVWPLHVIAADEPICWSVVLKQCIQHIFHILIRSFDATFTLWVAKSTIYNFASGPLRSHRSNYTVHKLATIVALQNFWSSKPQKYFQKFLRYFLCAMRSRMRINKINLPRTIPSFLKNRFYYYSFS